jgi:hypothetical protein
MTRRQRLGQVGRYGGSAVLPRGCTDLFGLFSALGAAGRS